MPAQTWQRSNPPQRVPDSAALRSASGPAAPSQQRQRHDGKSDRQGRHQPNLTVLESWVEVSSHPSSSSVSSIGDEIVTTGLQVGSSYHPQRRRRLRAIPQNNVQQQQQATLSTGQASQAGATSSQEEYDESESEEDRVLTSSTEHITSAQAIPNTSLRRAPHAQVVDESDSSDDDDRRTALARRPPEPFQPQPNAFSHPPSHLTHRHSTSSTMPQHHHRPSFSQRSQTRVDRRTQNFMSPNYQADNDAALRASLTTLLSCAAAASKRKEDEKELGDRSGAAAAAGTQPVGIRLVPESELMDPSPPPAQTRAAAQSQRNGAPAPTAREAGEKVKRAATPTSGAKPPRATKKKKTNWASGEETLISPTLLTWVVSAGVVVLVSVVGFGAGYVIGREVGRQETLNGLGAVGNASTVADGSSCGRDVIRGSGGTLRRFRWGTAVGRSIAA
ncbi:hypothetical protein GGR52DRAFT_537897 [Hypoxylon sp. FL1284]|nr:hypothetical protein GGR52DRAFT_537897 [Hypoxylon sp. FL1284]